MTRDWNSDTLEKTETPTAFSLVGQSDLDPHLRTLHVLGVIIAARPALLIDNASCWVDSL
jgi:hypothetical protein